LTSQDDGHPPPTTPSEEGRPQRGAGSGGHLEQRIHQEGSLPGNPYVVIRRQDLGSFRRDVHGMLVATRRADEPAAGTGRTMFRLKQVLLGRSLPTTAAESEQLPVKRALPTLASDALSSVAYGPEAGLAVLALAGVGAFAFELPIAIAIAVLMALVVLSYRQLVLTRPADGGSYAAARDYLGRWPAMVAAAALLVDYVLTVAVSVSSGADALASAFPALIDIRMPLAVALALFLCAGNLRGVREAGALFSIPTYIFVAAMVGLIVVGLIRGLTGAAHHAIGVYPPIPHPVEMITPFLILTAFASGCSSMTGIEAVANSVRSFRQPQGPNAARTLLLLGGTLVVIFLGVTMLDVIYGAAPHPSGSPTVLAQIAADVFSGPDHFIFYLIQFSTMLVLILAANASFNGFPRLCAVLARDGRLPHRFGAFGDRLVYSVGILVLAAISVAVVVVFNANTDHLINLYAIGVFTAFTLAQTAMVRHGLLTRGPGWRRNLFINGLGATATLVVDMIVLVVKFRLGAWVVLIIIPLLIWYFWFVERHYQRIRSELEQVPPTALKMRHRTTVVPIRELGSPTTRALRYASVLGGDVVALNLSADPAVREGIAEVLEQASRDPGQLAPVRATTVERPEHDGVKALMRTLQELQARAPGQLFTVMVPEYVTSASTLALLRRPGLLRLKLALLRRHDIVAASYPAAWQLTSNTDEVTARRHRVAMVPVSALDAPAARGLSYAQSIADEVIAVHVATGQPQDAPPAGEGSTHEFGSEDFGMEPNEEAKALIGAWDSWVDQYLGTDPSQPRPQLQVVLSPYRTVVQPVLRYLLSYREGHRDEVCTVVLTELVTRHLWNQLLHNHRAFHIKSALLGRADFAVADVTYDLHSPHPSR
jgi:amino acid transporter